MDQSKFIALTNNVRRGGFIIGSYSDKGISFSDEPVVHADSHTARMECKRLALNNPGKVFIFVKLVGAEFVPTMQTVSI